MAPPQTDVGVLPTIFSAHQMNEYMEDDSMIESCLSSDSDDIIFFEDSVEQNNTTAINYDMQTKTQEHTLHKNLDNLDYQNLTSIPSEVVFKKEIPTSQIETHLEQNTCSSPIPRELSVEDAFKMVFEVYSEGKLNYDLPIRPHASPIFPSEPCFYLQSQDTDKANIPESERGRIEIVTQCVRKEVERRKLVKSEKERREKVKKKRKLNSPGAVAEQEEKISVKFQSFNGKNSDIWWSEKHDFLFGVVSRAMSKTARARRAVGTSKENSNEETKVDRRHGYAGKIYTLIMRSSDIRDNGENLRNVRSLIVPHVPSLVQFWKLEDGDASVTSTTSTKKCLFEKTVVYEKTVPGLPSQPSTSPKIQDSAVFENLHIKGDLLVEGNILGKLITPPGAADYAEWFPYLHKSEEILPGMVVQLRSPSQRITLDTSKKGPHIIVSTTPSVSAGVPADDNSARNGALCAFLGQVPVMVQGPVKCGDYLFPSHLNDGLAISHNRLNIIYKNLTNHADMENEPLGTAMESCPAGKHTILCFVRWQHNINYQIRKQNTNSLNSSIGIVWLNCFGRIFETMCVFSYLYSRRHLSIEIFFGLGVVATFIIAASQFPTYTNFIERGDAFVFLLFQFFRFSYGGMKLCCCLSYSGDTQNLADQSNIGYGQHPADIFMSILIILSSMVSIYAYISLLISCYRLAEPDKRDFLVFRLLKQFQSGYAEQMAGSLDRINMLKKES